MKADVSRALDTALERLHRIWEEIGIVEDQRRDRMDVVVVHLRNLLDEMVNEEERMKEKIMKKVRHFKEQLCVLTRELKLPDYKPPEGLTMLRLEKNLQAQVDTLNTQKNERLQKLKQLRQKDQHLCDVLCATPYYIPSGCVPTKEQLLALEEHIGNLTREEERRRQIFRNTKISIAKYMDDLEECPNTSFERDVLCEEEDSFLLNNGNLKTLKDWHDGLERKSNDNYALANDMRSRIKTLWERLETPEEEREEFFSKYTGYKPSVISAMKDEIGQLERLKHQNLQKVLDGARADLQHWWDKCFVGENERFKFKPFYEQTCSEESLEAHDQEVNRLKAYYELNKDMIENVAKWQTLFQKFLDFEKKTSDPSRLFNRGGALLKEQKERKKFENQLPKIEAEVKEQIEEWEAIHKRQFLVDGVRFVDYIQNQWEDYQRNKENEKDQRHRARAQETEHELMYGSRPATTPNKRRLLPGGTPNGKTPNKLRKTDENDNESCDTKVCDGTQTTTMSSTTSSSSSDGKTTLLRNTLVKVARKPPAKLGGKPVRKLNDTPGSVSRMGRSAYQTTTMCSPVCMPPRSTTKLDDAMVSSDKTPRPGLPRPDHTPRTESRHVLKDKNVPATTTTASNDTLFSQTTISSNTLSSTVKSESLASVGPYQDFAKGLNEKSRENHRSSVLPSAAGFKPPAFF